MQVIKQTLYHQATTAGLYLKRPRLAIVWFSNGRDHEPNVIDDPKSEHIRNSSPQCNRSCCLQVHQLDSQCQVLRYVRDQVAHGQGGGTISGPRSGRHQLQGHPGRTAYWITIGQNEVSQTRGQ